MRWAKERGIAVTAEVTPHHLLLTCDLLRVLRPGVQGQPAAAPGRDVEALRAALADGTIDAVATDHAPHAVDDKDNAFGDAAFGMLGLQTALGVVAETMVEPGLLDWAGVADRMSRRGRRAIGRVAGHGARSRSARRRTSPWSTRPARWTVDPARCSRRKSRNTPFAGRTLPARVVATLLRGRADRAATVDGWPSA